MLINIHCPGAIIFIISFFGCCGASKESKCMMYTYGFFLFLILIAQVRCCPAVLIICKCCVL